MATSIGQIPDNVRKHRHKVSALLFRDQREICGGRNHFGLNRKGPASKFIECKTKSMRLLIAKYLEKTNR